jgi:hypothetical protein
MFDVSIYPNKVGMVSNVKIDLPQEGKFNAILLDLSGRKMGRYFANERRMSIELKNLPRSVYILQIFNEWGNMQTFKLIYN